MSITHDDVLTDDELSLNDGDWGRHMAHYTDKHGLVEAMVMGTPVIALCGWRFIPRRDPERYPVCPRCKAIHELLPQGED